MTNHYQGKKRLISTAASIIKEQTQQSELSEAPLKEGDYVRLKQPFRPDLSSPEECHCGVVVKLIQASPKEDTTEVTGIVLYLYNPQTFMKYQDESGEKILYYFRQDEVEPYSSK